MKQRVLAIDDNEHFVKLLEHGLTQRGYEVITATAPLEGIQLADESPPHAIVLDYDMPGVDGIETLRVLKNSRSTAGIPIIMLSGAIDPECEAQSLQEGAAQFLRKDAKNLTELLDRLEEALRKVTGS